MHHLGSTVLLVACASACAAAEHDTGFDSPAEAFRAYVTGAATEDYNLMLSSLTPESRAYHIGLCIFSAAYLFGEDPAMQKLLEEHGVTRPPTSEQGDEPPEKDEHADNDEAEDKAFVDFILTIKKPAELMKRIADRHKKLAEDLAERHQPEGTELAKPEGLGEKKREPTTEQIISSIKLEKVQVTGNTARATVKSAAVTNFFVARFPDPIEFRRIDNRWYCHIDPR